MTCLPLSARNTVARNQAERLGAAHHERGDRLLDDTHRGCRAPRTLMLRTERIAVEWRPSVDVVWI
jgi:hypothetical protein